MTKTVDLILWGSSEYPVTWTLGAVRPIEATPHAINACVQKHLDTNNAQAWLFWNAALGSPDPDRVLDALSHRGDLWHSGLRLGKQGLPGLIDFVTPTWRLNCDPAPNIEAASWRLSLGACLVHVDVLRQMGSVRSDFQTIEGAALEMGYRYVTHGVFAQHLPSLLSAEVVVETPVLPFEDELRFVYYCFGRFWGWWALGRALLTGYASVKQILWAMRKVHRAECSLGTLTFTRKALQPIERQGKESVSVLIPTLDRYPHLRTLLSQLRQQTVKPMEIIVVDQTSPDQRETTLREEFSDLPLKILFMDKPGQCSSRNAGLQFAQGEYVLFMDDDNEIPATLIEAHLQNLYRCRASVSSGVSEEVGAGPLSESFTYARVSDVFPTNNSLIRRDVLQKSGLFDLAYERGQRADGDLGMRIYLSGASMVLQPGITVLHHHAPRGGLRAHKARVITYASSRHSLGQRHLPSVTDIYLAKRYFTPRQVREMLWLSVFGTFSIRGGIFKKILKIMISFLYLPDTLWQIRQRHRQATRMLQNYPQIPTLVSRNYKHEPRI